VAAALAGAEEAVAGVLPPWAAVVAWMPAARARAANAVMEKARKLDMRILPEWMVMRKCPRPST
jgi:hypothetical protein